MKNINWSQLEKNSESKELGFEQFCFQIAYKEYANLGKVRYYYNTPGSEFYVTLEQDSTELSLEAEDVIGWQAKFWRGNADEDNSPLNQKHRDELIEGFRKTVDYQPNIKIWIICTPGKFQNTKPHTAVDKLESELKKIKPDVKIEYWHKDIFLAFALRNTNFYGALFNHYFSTKFIGFEYIKNFSEKKLDRLSDKFDIDIYVENKVDDHIKYLTESQKVEERLKEISNIAIQYINNQKKHNRFEKIECKYIDKKYFADMEFLLEERCKLIDDINFILLNEYNPYLIDNLLAEHHEKTESVINSLNKKHKDKSYLTKDKKDKDENGGYNHELYIHNSYMEFINKVSSFLFDFDNSDTDNVEYLISCFFQSYIHIMGAAGYGKTNLACAICKKHLDNKIPALLILGSNIKESSTPQEQIVASLELKNEFSFYELLFALNNLGKFYKCKIPIIIDGLNESTPTAKVWKESLPDIIHDVKSFNKLILITTLRDGYINQIFEKNSVNDIINGYKIEGFDDFNVKEAVQKYFSKYDISVRNQFDMNLFKNPLLLKIFCIANQHNSSISVSQNNIYKSIEDYIINLISKIAEGDPLRKSKAIKGVEAVAKHLWDNNSRTIPYPDDYVCLIDGNISTFENSVSHAMMDEGMFFIRNFDVDHEEIQFTYDLIAGFCIGRYYLLKNKTEDDVRSFFNSDDFKKINNKDKGHPLAEDILKALFYLTPKQCNGKTLYEMDSVQLSSIDYISNLDILSQEEGDRKNLLRFFSNMNLEEPEIEILCEKIYTEIFERNSFNNVEILFTAYSNWTNYQRDIYWNEKTRKRVWKVLELLKKISKDKYFSLLSEQDLYYHLLFCILLFSSTDNALRNLATKTAVTISEQKPSLILKILNDSKDLSDLYVLERIVATLCGTILRIQNKSFTNESCEYLQEIFLPNTKTNHVVILDYIETILEFGKHQYNYPYSKESLFRNKDEVWREDKPFEKKIAKHGHYDMGVDIFDYDFTKYQINYLLDDQKTKFTYKSIYSRLHFRCNIHGYEKGKYEELERRVSEEQRYRRDGDMDSMENYRFKYLWTSYYEFVGFLIVNGIFKKKYNSTFRIDYLTIDPTFPQLPNKIQLVNDCFLPSYKEDVQAWVNSDKKDYFDNVYCTTLHGEGNDEWILLNASCIQEDDEYKTKHRITISVETLFYDTSETLKYIKSNKFSFIINGIHSIYSGELPWGINTHDDEYFDINDSNIIMASSYYSFTSWDNHRSRLCERFSYLNKEISNFLNLSFNPVDLSYYNGNERITKLLWANGSSFYYIKKKYLKEFLKINKLKMVHHKFIAKYGEFSISHDEKILNPSTKTIKVDKVMII